MKQSVLSIGGVSLPIVSLNTLVIGSGAAALSAAVHLIRYGQKDIAVVTEKWGAGTSNNAGSDKQTYYKLSLSGETQDSPMAMAKDLFRGGCMHGDIALCEAAHSAQAFFHLVHLGVPFPHDACGMFVGYRTDHDPKGRASSAGPLTSRWMVQALGSELKARGVRVFDRHQVVRLLMEGKGRRKRVIGALALDLDALKSGDSGFVAFNAVNVVLGTGGPAGIYRTSVYPESQIGSHGLAFEVGAVGHNLTESQFGIASVKFRWNLSGSYQQVIPRYVSTDPDGKEEREFLNDVFPDMKTLANAIFLKGYQWPFDPRKIHGYGSSLIDLLVYRESVIRKRRVFLDFMHNPGTDGRLERFSLDLLGPEAYAYLEKSGALKRTPIQRLARMNRPAIALYRRHGIDLSKEYLEIAVCAQHNNGGLKGNIWWESNIRHLFPVGEVNGTHGVYRPGGSALNSGQVGGIRAALFISRRYTQKPLSLNAFRRMAEAQVLERMDFVRRVQDGETGREVQDVIEEIRERMSACGACIRDPKRVRRELRNARRLWSEVKQGLRFSAKTDIPSGFRAQDLCLTHLFYLEAIAEYIARGGQSRGSYLVLNPEGEKPCPSVEDEWRFRLNQKGAFVEKKILEVWMDPRGRIRRKWVDIRPIPQEGAWFETVWNRFLRDEIIR